MTTEERLESLERELARAKRRNRWVLAAVGLGALAWTVMGAALAGGPSPQAVPAGKVGPAVDKIADPQPGAVVPKVIRANVFILEDADGNCRAVMSVLSDGPALRLVDENGKVRVILSVTKDGPALRLVDENGKTRASLESFKDEPGLCLADGNGKNCATLAITKDGPGLGLADESGKTRASLDSFKHGPALRLVDENGKVRANLGWGNVRAQDGRTMTYPESSLLLMGPDGKVIWKTP